MHSKHIHNQMSQICLDVLVCSLKDMLYKRRMERQLAAARGEGPAPERAPDEVSRLCLTAMHGCPCMTKDDDACNSQQTVATLQITTSYLF